jgi:exopolysaccharide production protein ExoQ
MAKLLRQAEYGFTVISLVLYTGGILFLLISGGANQSDITVTYDTSLYKLSFILIYLVTICLLLLKWKQALYTLTREPLIIAILGLCCASTFWSSSPSATIMDNITLIGSSLFGLYLATRYSLKQQLELICWAFGIGVILSFPFALLLPKYGQMGGLHTGAWRGVYSHKNGLGANMVSSIMAYTILYFQNLRHRWIPLLMVLLATVLISFSRSTSALLNAILIVAAILILKIIRWRYRSMIAAIMSMTLALEILLIWLVGNAQSLADGLGKDLTLTGRTVLWSAVWEMIQKQPWFGYGYGGFWDVTTGGEAAYIWLATGWKMNHPHNGFLAIWLDLGLVGLICFMILLVQSFYRSLLLARLDHSPASFLPVVCLFSLVTSNLTETAFLSSNSYPWLFFVALTLTVIKELEKKAVVLPFPEFSHSHSKN